jgi:hypothetical protein
MQTKLIPPVTVRIEVVGVSPLSFGKCHDTPHLSNEKDLAYEVRTHSEKLHFYEDGELYVPGMMFKKCLDAAVKRTGEKIPGRRNHTYTKHFESGCRSAGHFALTCGGRSIFKHEVPYEKLFVPSDGVAGSGKRVWKCFPKINQWECYGEFMVFDNIIDEDTFKKMLKHAGTFIGLARWRVQNQGDYGIFIVKTVDWQKND